MAAVCVNKRNYLYIKSLATQQQLGTAVSPLTAHPARHCTHFMLSVLSSLCYINYLILASKVHIHLIKKVFDKAGISNYDGVLSVSSLTLAISAFLSFPCGVRRLTTGRQEGIICRSCCYSVCYER